MYATRFRNCVCAERDRIRGARKKWGAKGRGRPYGGKFMRRKRSWKRGSERMCDTPSPWLRPCRSTVSFSLKANTGSGAEPEALPLPSARSSDTSGSRSDVPSNPASCARPVGLASHDHITRPYSSSARRGISTIPKGDIKILRQTKPAISKSPASVLLSSRTLPLAHPFHGINRFPHAGELLNPAALASAASAKPPGAQVSCRLFQSTPYFRVPSTHAPAGSTTTT